MLYVAPNPRFKDEFEERSEFVKEITPSHPDQWFLAPDLARSRGFEGYGNRKSFKINPSDQKVFTTEPPIWPVGGTP